jgi:signal transduction histidine kinase
VSAHPQSPSFEPIPAHRARSGSRLSTATWLAGVSLLALLPMLAFSAYIVRRAIDEQQAQALATQQRSATDSAAAIGRQLESLFAVLRTLSQAESVRQGDMAATYALAARVVEADPRIVGISVVDASGAQPFNTLRPFGTLLPRPSPALMEMQRVILEQGRRVVSPLVIGEVSQRQVVGVGMPLSMGPAGTYALRVVVRLESIGGWLNEQAWPDDWTAAVLDQNGTIIARSRDAARYLGQPATQLLQDNLRSGLTEFESFTKDGIAVITSVARVPGTGWHVAVGRPTATLNAHVRHSMQAILVAGALCALLAVVGALYLARRLGRQLRGVVDAHVQGQSGPVSRSTLREVAELADALADARATAARATRDMQDAKEEALTRLKERSEMLDVLAHEVRQPLNNASAALQAASVELERDGRKSADEPLRRAEVVLGEVQASIGNTLAVASLLVGGERIEGVDTDIDALIEVAIADMPRDQRERVVVERATNTRTASMEPGLMRLALRNLLSNALRCSPPGSPVVVRVSDSDEPLALILDVIDRGAGIADELLPRLFQRKARHPGGRRQGLGLYIVRRVMELHRGSVLVERSGAGGTTMRLIINQHAVV